LISESNARFLVGGFEVFDPRFGSDMMEAVTQTTSDELRAQVNQLRLTAARLIEQASRLVECCAEPETHISLNFKAKKS